MRKLGNKLDADTLNLQKMKQADLKLIFIMHALGVCLRVHVLLEKKKGVSPRINNDNHNNITRLCC